MKKTKEIIMQSRQLRILLILFIVSTFVKILMFTGLCCDISVIDSRILDNKLFYNGSVFSYNLAVLGEEGRKTYLLYHLFDYFHILVFFPLLYYLIVMLPDIAKVKKNKIISRLSIFPLLGCIFSVLENFVIDVAILNYPNVDYIFANVCGVFTLIKIITTLISFIIILYFGAKIVLQKFRQNKL